MSELARFFGIVVAIFFREHGVPHVHFMKGGKKLVVRVDEIRVLNGKLDPADQLRAVRWARNHQPQLLEAWRAARLGMSPKPIAPLPEHRSSRTRKKERDAPSRSRSPGPSPWILLAEWIEGNETRLFFRVPRHPRTGREHVEVKEMKIPYVRSTRTAKIVHGGAGLDPGDGFEMSADRLYAMPGRFVMKGP